jgi:hypothetical protein
MAKAIADGTVTTAKSLGLISDEEEISDVDVTEEVDPAEYAMETKPTTKKKPSIINVEEEFVMVKPRFTGTVYIQRRDWEFVKGKPIQVTQYIRKVLAERDLI